MKIALAVNPRASFGRGRHAGGAAAECFRASGAEVELLCEDSYAALAARVADAVAGGVDALVVVGGDGMVHLGVNALAAVPAVAGADGRAPSAAAGTAAGTPLGIIPTGTGNDLARMLELPRHDIPAAVERVLAALGSGGRRIDAGRAVSAGRTHWFAGVLSAGFDAAVNERANAWRWPRGQSRYNLAMLRELAGFTAIDYTLTVDGERRRQGAMLVSVANGRSMGGGMAIAPEASLEDGLLDLFVVHPLSRAALLAVFPKVFTGRHVGHPAVELRRVRRVVLEGDGVVAYADGERLGPLPLTIDVVPGALRVLA